MIEVANKIFVWPPHHGVHYQAALLQALVHTYKVKWLSSTQLRVLTPTPILITSPDLEDLFEASTLWPAHQQVLDQILTMAKTMP